MKNWTYTIQALYKVSGLFILFLFFALNSSAQYWDEFNTDGSDPCRYPGSAGKLAGLPWNGPKCPIRTGTDLEEVKIIKEKPIPKPQPNPFPVMLPPRPNISPDHSSGIPISPGNPAKDKQKEKDLEDELNKNPDLLIDCTLLQKFKSFVNYKPPQLVFDRINRLNSNTQHNLFSKPYFVHQIKNAAGYKINLDRFEINVNTLPVVNGARLTADQFLKYIRNHFNDFFETSIAEFSPYSDPADKIQDGAIWASDNPLGAILHIEMADDGAVVVSDYASNYWTVSTLRTPLDFAHPVSGNRKWGYELGNSTNPNGYTFYVTGVDRLTLQIDEVGQYIFRIPFNAADKLWESYQAKVAGFTNNNSGSATIGSMIKERPDYEAIKDYLSGKISLQQLKDKKGCK